MGKVVGDGVGCGWWGVVGRERVGGERGEGGWAGDVGVGEGAIEFRPVGFLTGRKSAASQQQVLSPKLLGKGVDGGVIEFRTLSFLIVRNPLAPSLALNPTFGLKPGLKLCFKPGHKPGRKPGFSPGLGPGLKPGLKPGLWPGLIPGLWP